MPITRTGKTTDDYFEFCLEVAARKLCESRGIDPDAIVADASNNSMAYYTITSWRNAAVELKDALVISQLIKTLPI